jgi:hypothetical protein
MKNFLQYSFKLFDHLSLFSRSPCPLAVIIVSSSTDIRTRNDWRACQDLDKNSFESKERNFGIYYESIARFPELKICIILYSLYFSLALISPKLF